MLFLSFIIILTCFIVYWLFGRIMLTRTPFKYAKVNIHTVKAGHYLNMGELPIHSHFDHSSRKRIMLDMNWIFEVKTKGTFEEVRVPHSYNVAKSKYKDHEGIVSYSRQLMLTPAIENALAMNQSVHLVIEGGFYSMRVYINEVCIGENKGGYLPFRLDVTNYFRIDKVLDLRIELDNQVNSSSLPPLVYPGHALGFHPYGGLHKPVYLEIMPDTYLFKLHMTPKIENKEGDVNILAMWHWTGKEIKAEKCTIELYDNEGIQLVEKEAFIEYEGNIGYVAENFIVNHLKLWSVDSPYLYKIQVTTENEQLSGTFGFSIVKVEGGRIIHNNEVIRLNGICRHEEDIVLGQAQSQEQMNKDFALIKELNMNYVRLTHYPHDPYFLEKCDREGLFVWEEIPLYQAGLAPIKYIGDKSVTRQDPWYVRPFRSVLMMLRTRQLTNPLLLTNAHDELLRMIERDYNHPSILFWGIGNECWTLNPAGQKALHRLKILVQQVDNHRLAGYAAMTIPGLTGVFERSFKEMDFIGINEYFGWYYGNTRDVGKLLKKLHLRFPDKPILVTETGADAACGFYGGEGMKASSETYQKNYLEEQLEILDKAPNFAGFSIWVLKDFLCPEYSTDNIVPFYNLKGLVTADYKKKQSFYTVKEMLAQKRREGEEG